ncbi:hypothetical protein KAFR_0J00300 [Kazachstania africana CBS 2517]|uniref:peptide-methionine (S)-S-oxide reductase n=1 Tax=Kazachstania africana (strain ATCC 22294 / BCRC 22015 / CBS 2517 / CECT 1963 / NBRC 1671 / NRRL Y-8276) TaxID=1071382 RepID=H2B0E8_KAZAF|nr:hypothetical protein KAFR_0J00300 [Kazachstania africana CBS 2517]CCF60098.1 hypothetical protein KAFR_0J00300 [Kazachstania africana CBS 2517]
MTSNIVSKTIKYNPQTDRLITVAAGCFWGTEHMYRKHLGDRIIDCKVGFANGIEDSKDQESSVSYKRVCKGDTNFAEVLQISYNPTVITLKELVDFFFRIHDPTTLNVQGPDIGTQYRSALYAHSQSDLNELHKLKNDWEPKWGNKISTQIEPIHNYYDAEEYHQIYLDKNPEGYACPTHYLRDI